MGYRLKVTVEKLDQSTPTIWPYITDFHPVGPGGYADQQKDGGDPVETYSWRVLNPPQDLWFLFGFNVQIIPEGSSWWWNFLINIAGTTTTILCWYTLNDVPVITWKIQFNMLPYAFNWVRSSDNQSSATVWETVTYDKTAPYLDSFAKVEGGDARVYWYLHFQGALGYAHRERSLGIVPSLNQFGPIQY